MKISKNVFKGKMYPILMLFSIVFLVGCSKTEINDVSMEPNSSESKSALSHAFNMPNHGVLDFKLPEVPDYFAGVDDNSNVDGDDASLQKHNLIQVHPGTNQLQGIIDNASPGTTIMLLAGEHIEENTLVINHRVHLRGKKGAVLSLGGTLGLAVVGANGVSIKHVEFNNAGSAVMGIGIENSMRFVFRENTMAGFLFSIVLEHADRARIHKNSISGIDMVNGLGIVAMNGRHVWIHSNSVSGSLFGIWLNDKGGLCTNNTTYQNTFGMILCRVGEGFLSAFFNSGTGGADLPATSWWVRGNLSHDNVWGYIVIDGANKNFLSNNRGHNNAFVDLELAGETVNLFGFPVPGSFNNIVRAADLNYIDCGLNNRVYGGNEAGLPCSE